MCRNLSDLDTEAQDILWQAAEASNKYISKPIFRSLTEKLSYEDLQKEDYIPYGKEDFYGYQRLCILYFKNLMIFAGKYKQ